MTRILITGGPRTGKTTLANRIADEYGDHVGTTVAHTDDLIATHDWSAASAEVATWLDAPGPWIIEGVAVCRALRKWRSAHLGERPPVDKVIRLTEPYKSLTPGQATMAKGEEKVWREIETWILHAGVAVEYRDDEVQCGDCGTMGLHGCQGVPGGFGDEAP